MPNGTLPNNTDAEQALLGSILIDPDAIVKVLTMIRPEDFYLERHGWIYQALTALFERHSPIDFLTVVDELERRKRLDDVGGASHITSLINAVPTAIHVAEYAKQVRRLAVKRGVIHAAGEIAGFAYDPELDEDETLSKSQASLAAVSATRRTSFESIHDVAERVGQRVLQRFENPDQVWALPTGFAALDKALGGLERQNQIIVAGRPGSGKSAFAQGIALNVAEKQKHVAIFTLEMSSDEVFQRMACMHGGWIYDEVRRAKRALPNGGWRPWTEDEQTKYLQSLAHVQGLPIHITDKSAIRTTEATAMVSELALTEPVDLIIFDYLGLAGDKANRDSRYEQVGAISRGLKNMAKSLDVPLITLAQLNRECEKRADRKPDLVDLRDAGDCEQDSDIVILIWRPAMYWDSEAKWQAAFSRDPYPGNVTELIIAKFRNGSTGHVNLYFDATHMRFADLVPS